MAVELFTLAEQDSTKAGDHPTSPGVYQLEGELPGQLCRCDQLRCASLVLYIRIKLFLIIFSSFSILLNSFSLNSQILLFFFPSVLAPIPGEGSVSKQLCGVYLPAKLNYNI